MVMCGYIGKQNRHPNDTHIFAENPIQSPHHTIDRFALGSSHFKVPIHLGLVDRPFVAHQLSAQDSPVPLPKLQMAPRLKILMSSGSNNGTQIHYPFLSKSPSKRIPSRFPNGAPMEIPAYGAFLHLS